MIGSRAAEHAHAARRHSSQLQLQQPARTRGGSSLASPWQRSAFLAPVSQCAMTSRHDGLSLVVPPTMPSFFAETEPAFPTELEALPRGRH